MHYKQEELLKLQQTEVEILEEIIRICQEEGLTYFAMAGTALGAVRHNGFIPWDDDIDIAMMREDFERFLKVAPEKLGGQYVLQHFKTDPNTPGYFAKVRKNGTRFVEEWAKDMPIHHGIFVDIFPFDCIPEEEGLRKWHRWVCSFWRELYFAKTMKKSCISMDASKLLAVNIIRFTLHCLMKPVSKAWLYNQVDTRFRRYNKKGTAMVSGLCYANLENRYEDIFPVKQLPFENISINVSGNVDKTLKRHYGNYMQLPPEDKRITHAPLEICFPEE